MFLLGSNKGAKKSLRNKTKGKKKKGKISVCVRGMCVCNLFFFFQIFKSKISKKVRYYGGWRIFLVEKVREQQNWRNLKYNYVCVGSKQRHEKKFEKQSKGKQWKGGKSHFASAACASATYIFFFKLLILKFPKRSDIAKLDQNWFFIDKFIS